MKALILYKILYSILDKGDVVCGAVVDTG